MDIWDTELPAVMQVIITFHAYILFKLWQSFICILILLLMLCLICGLTDYGIKKNIYIVFPLFFTKRYKSWGKLKHENFYVTKYGQVRRNCCHVCLNIVRVCWPCYIVCVYCMNSGTDGDHHRGINSANPNPISTIRSMASELWYALGARANRLPTSWKWNRAVLGRTDTDRRLADETGSVRKPETGS